MNIIEKIDNYLDKPGYTVVRNIQDRKPLFKGTRIACLKFMDKNWDRYGGLDIIGPDGRMSSFVLDKELENHKTNISEQQTPEDKKQYAKWRSDMRKRDKMYAAMRRNKKKLEWTIAELKDVQNVFGPNTSVYEGMELDELKKELVGDDEGYFPTKKMAIQHLLYMEEVFMDHQEESMISSVYRREESGALTKEQAEKKIATARTEFKTELLELQKRVNNYIKKMKE
jgi:hypothetical protein